MEITHNLTLFLNKNENFELKILPYIFEDFEIQIQIEEAISNNYLDVKDENLKIEGCTEIYVWLAQKWIQKFSIPKKVTEKDLLLGKLSITSHAKAVTRWIEWYDIDLKRAISFMNDSNWHIDGIKGFPCFPPQLFVLSHSLLRKPHIAANYVTIIDFLLFPTVHWFIESILFVGNNWESHSSHFLHLFSWFDNFQNRVEIQKMRAQWGVLPLLDVQAKFQFNLQDKEMMCKESDKGRPVMLVSDVSCAQPSRKKNYLQIGKVFDKLESNDLLLGNYLDKPPGLTKISWSQLDINLSPEAGMLNEKRTKDKKRQIENIISVAEKLLCDGETVVDFCSGGGHLAIQLAYIFPNCNFVLVDRKDVSLAHAIVRIQSLGLKNVRIFHGDLFNFKQHFDLAIAIHACGFLTDLILDIALQNKSKFIISPCCFGGMSNSKVISYPRSALFNNSHVTKDEYMHLISCADLNTHAKNDFESELYDIGKKCMAYIDFDRLNLAKEMGYTTMHHTMYPKHCTPKNEIIAGYLTKKDVMLTKIISQVDSAMK